MPPKTWLSRREYAIWLRCERYGVYYGRVSRLAVFRRDNWTCQLCHKRIDPLVRWPNKRCATIDHILPMVKGGDHRLANCQAAHFDCNASKGARG